MKRIFIALAAFMTLSLGVSAQQVKSPADAAKAVDAAEKTAENPKNAAKTATWLKLAKAYKGAYDAAVGPAIKGVDKAQVSVLLGSEKPSSVTSVVVGGQPYTKEVYENRNLYFNGNNILVFIEVTKEVVENSRQKSLTAYQKAASLDPKGSKTKEISEGIDEISKTYLDDALTAYNVGNVAKSSKYFSLAAAAKETAPLNQIDTTAIYNTAVTALMVNDDVTAEKYLNRCKDIKYFEDGEVFAKLGQVYQNRQDTVAMVKVLEEGFVEFPKNQSILIGLINYYLTSKTNTQRLFDLLDKAKQNEPNNASLYYVEGNIHKELKEYDAAAASYNQASEVNPSYEYGFIGCGQMYYDLAVDASTAASNEADDNKYMALMDKANDYLKKSISPFESAFKVSTDKEVRLIIAEYLKNIYFRFRTQDEGYAANYEKYKNICDTKEIPN
ncbi:MAG: hypothetical protein HUJ95_05475 [Bacteroidales bacterium]|nr:hypothetical protein [Bacteroidales bacterium]